MLLHFLILVLAHLCHQILQEVEEVFISCFINIPHIFNSYPDNEPRKIGAYISWVAIATTCVTSSMFLTALAPKTY